MMKPLLIFLFIVSSFCLYSQELKKETRVIFQVVEQMPEYPGGEEKLHKFIQSNLIYPDSAFNNKIEGKVVVGFTVTQDGSISGIYIMKGVSPDIDKEALRLINLLGRFKPGMQSGKPVQVQYVIPILFTLAQNSISSKPHLRPY